MNDCAIRLPSEDEKWLEFKNHLNKERLPFMVYADLECVSRQTELGETEAASYIYQQHEVFSVGYVRCSYNDALSAYRFQRGGLRCMVRSTTRRLGASSKNFVIRKCLHGNVIKRTVGGIP
ncbi:hypothetical protein P5V15_010240 [Pogonomyrmex californicus]